MVRCPYCGRETVETERICWFCGQDITSTRNEAEKPRLAPKRRIEKEKNESYLVKGIEKLKSKWKIKKEKI